MGFGFTPRLPALSTATAEPDAGDEERRRGFAAAPRLPNGSGVLPGSRFRRYSLSAGIYECSALRITGVPPGTRRAPWAESRPSALAAHTGDAPQPFTGLGAY